MLRTRSFVRPHRDEQQWRPEATILQVGIDNKWLHKTKTHNFTWWLSGCISCSLGSAQLSPWGKALLPMTTCLIQFNLLCWHTTALCRSDLVGHVPVTLWWLLMLPPLPLLVLLLLLMSENLILRNLHNPPYRRQLHTSIEWDRARGCMLNATDGACLCNDCADQCSSNDIEDELLERVAVLLGGSCYTSILV